MLREKMMHLLWVFGHRENARSDLCELLEQVDFARKTHDRTLNVLRLKSEEVRTFS